MAGASKLLAARDLLAQIFGHSEFRPGQAEAVEAALGGRDSIVLLATGSGKSLCFQIPAIVASRAGRGTTIVISPLIALMHDQVGALAARGVPAAALHSGQDDAEQKQAVVDFLRGELALLYVSPERAAQAGFRRMLGRTPIALLAIDEAHCVSQWGHDFRPDYMRIHELREIVETPAIALTATATPMVMEEIENRLALRAPVVVRSGFDRPNLRFSVQPLRSQAARLAALQAEIASAGLQSGHGSGRGLVYCSTRKTTETVAKALRSAGIAAGYYHAGRTKLARERAQRAFETRRTRILVATNAFGMGIDLPDIRLIVHFQTPGSIEAYYQEAGRAGRDGEASCCVLFFGPGDLATQRRLHSSASTSAAIANRNELALAAVEKYATRVECRQRRLSAHFTGSDDRPACGNCDVCEDAGSVRSAQARFEPDRPAVRLLGSDAHESIVRAVDRLSRPVGKANLARALRGSRAKSLARGGLLMLPEYGSLAEYDEASIVAAVDALLADGRLRRTGRKYPTVWIPGKPIRASTQTNATENDGAAARKPLKRRSSRHGGPLARALDNYRRRQARALKWKTYMVFQRRAILAIDREEPDSLDALARIPGLGPAKIERFGKDILDLVRRHRIGSV
ncbi:MAG: RecQ family ATP-dependent DNA helicase [Deltaproteobacteria bacterium]|nr:RecQ family ATP-dependent DNA helicase [Deltaproteobacteria bacterium]